MARNTKIKTTAEGSKIVPSKTTTKAPSALAIAKRGVKTSDDFASLMGALMSDLIEGNISAEVGNATCKAGSNLLKVVEMQHKYGKVLPADKKSLQLVA